MQASQGNLGRLEEHNRIRQNLLRVFRLSRTMLVHIPSFGCHWAFATASDIVDPLGLSSQAVESALKERRVGTLSYYDEVTHQRIFALPRYVREALGIGPQQPL